MGLKFPSSNKPLPFPCLDSSASFRGFLANFSFYKIIFPGDTWQGYHTFNGNGNLVYGRKSFRQARASERSSGRRPRGSGVALDVMDRQRLGRDRDGVSGRKLSKLSESESKVRGVMGMKRYHSRGGTELLPLAESNLYLEL